MLPQFWWVVAFATYKKKKKKPWTILIDFNIVKVFKLASLPNLMEPR